MITLPDVRDHAWRCAITVAGALLAATFSVEGAVHAAQTQKAAILQDQTEVLPKSGYVELSGDDAVSFLVGNTVVLKKTDAPKGFAADERDIRYYFSDRHTVYECIAAAHDCSTQLWRVDGNEICFELPEQCDDPTYKLYAAPRLFKAPRPDSPTGRIGVYLTHKSIMHAVVKGNATFAPLFEPGGVGRMIEVNAADFAPEIEAASKFSGGDRQVPVDGARAISFLIGNTFISGETVSDAHGVHFCPEQGYYYSPDGRIITFNCFHWPDFWGMHVTHWKLASGRLCIEDVSGDGTFGCGDRFERVYLTPADRPDEWRVATDDFPLRKIVGYSGNVFNFR
jgi:hypothetical protein